MVKKGPKASLISDKTILELSNLAVAITLCPAGKPPFYEQDSLTVIGSNDPAWLFVTDITSMLMVFLVLKRPTFPFASIYDKI